ncbi:MAG: class I SAM-dependent methyltransferase [Phycisphaerales bacterium]
MTTDERAYLDPYLRAAEQFGPGFEALLWQSPKAQIRRFKTIAHMAVVKDRVVADIGCGNADLLLDLYKRDLAPKKYIGIDAVPQMLEHAREQARGNEIAEAEFLDHDFVRDEQLPAQLVDDDDVDAVVFSGSLNTLSETDARRVLDRFWRALARKPGTSLVFNFLSGRHNRERTPATPPAVRYDPLQMLHWAIDRTPLVTFRHDYLGGHDATICMRVPTSNDVEA